MTRLTAEGLAIEVVRGWDAQISTAPAGDASAAGPSVHQPVLHAANFALPVQRGEFGAGAVESMGPRHAFLAMVEFEPEAASSPLFGHPRPGPLTIHDLDPSQLQIARPGQAGCQRFFSESGRAFCIYAVVGSELMRPVLVPRLNDVVAAITVDAR